MVADRYNPRHADMVSGLNQGILQHAQASQAKSFRAVLNVLQAACIHSRHLLQHALSVFTASVPGPSQKSGGVTPLCAE